MTKLLTLRISKSQLMASGVPHISLVVGILAIFVSVACNIANGFPLN